MAVEQLCKTPKLEKSKNNFIEANQSNNKTKRRKNKMAKSALVTVRNCLSGTDVLFLQSIFCIVISCNNGRFPLCDYSYIRSSLGSIS